MRNELIETITKITETNLISNMLMNMNNRDLFQLMNLLEYTDENTQHRWIDTYNQLVMY